MSSYTGTSGGEGLCEAVVMTPTQHNEVIEDKLTNLVPVLKCTLSAFQRVDEIFQNGGINWRRALERAKQKLT